MKSVIFLGPSMPKQKAEEVLDAIYLPPVAQGDILTVLNRYKPDIIGIIDGVFYQNLSVWHKEILVAIDRGVYVVGASSMGALRAAELHQFGMHGVGEIFEDFASERLIDDDEVALVYGPAADGYPNLSDPMVNLRATFRAAERAGAISAEEHDILVDVAKQLYFPDRVLGNIFRAIPDSVIEPERRGQVHEACREHYVDLKQDDAIALLKHVRELTANEALDESDFELTRNHLLEALYQRDREVFCGETPVRQHRIVEHTAVHMKDFGAFNVANLNRAALLCLARYLHVKVSDGDIEEEESRFRMRLKLRQQQDLDAWLRDNDLTDIEFRDLMHEEAICRRLNRWITTFFGKVGSTKETLNGLRLRNQYVEWKKDTARHEEILREHYPELKASGFQDVAMRDLVVNQLRETDFNLDTHFVKWWREGGFLSPGSFQVALFRAHLVRQHLKQQVRSAVQDSQE